MALLRSHFRTEFDVQNAGNDVSGVQISKIFRGACPCIPLDYMVHPNFRIMPQSDF